MQPKPDTSLLKPQRFIEELDRILAQGLSSVHFQFQQGVPEQPRAFSAMTWVPFFMLCLDGHFDAQVYNGQEMQPIKVGPGDGIFFTPQVWVDVHHQRCKRYLRITFDEDHILCGLKDCSNAKQRREVGQLATWVYPRVLNKYGQALLREMQLLPHDQFIHSRIKDYCQTLLWQTRDALSYHRGQEDGSEATWLAVRDWCARHCCEGISRRDVCAAFRLSPSHMSRLCKAFSGMTLIDFIHELQLRHACDYLRETQMDIAGIAQSCGFNSANYFIRIFGKHMEQSPEQWRKQHLRHK